MGRGRRTGRDAGGSRPGRVSATVAVALTLAGGVLGAQEPIPIDHFDGWRSWPLYEAGELEIDAAPLGNLRAEFRFEVPSGDTMTMYVDVLEGSLRGQPALWIQHTSSGLEGDSTLGTTVIDGLLVDRESFRIAYRIQATRGARSWAGPYAFVQHRPERVSAVHVADDGTVETETLDGETDPFDFATMPFLFPFMEGGLQAGRALRLMNIGARGDRAPRPVAIRVMGRTTITDAREREREVWEVQLLSNSERMLVTIWVDETPPWFFGWRYRMVEDGALRTRMMYRDHRIF